ncbi:MAG: hypothetical protein IJB02_05270 [Oscillospiraceae bacterium]|nr:hypothetical protein [Oscillospiraceae bacterium]
MKFNLNSNLLNAYKTSNKNPNYSLSFLLSSLDLNSCNLAIDLVNTFNLSGEATAFELDSSNTQTIQKIFKKIDSSLVERLLWIALFFPEI